MVQPLSAITDPGELRLRSEMMLRMAGNLARFGGWSLDVTTNTNFWSDELCTILGYPVGAPPKVSEALGLYPDEDRQMVDAAMAECAEHGTPFDQLHNMHDANGRLLRVRIVGEAIRDAGGRITHVEGAVHDITAQKEEHDARMAVEERLALTLDSLTDGLITFDNLWHYSYLNPRAQALLGLQSGDVIGRVFWDIVPVEVQGRFGTAMREAVDKKRTVVHRDYHPVIDRWLEVTAYPSDAGVAVYIRDVTEEERLHRDSATNAEVIASQAALLDVARDAIVVRSLDHRFTYVNHAAELMYGYTRDQLIGKSVFDLVYRGNDAFEDATRIVLRDGQWSGDIEQHDKDGRLLIAECSWTLVRDASGEPQSILAVNTDVTSRRREEDLNLRRQRMESIGTLASGIAHDLNNVLAPLLLGVQLLSTTETDPARASLMTTMEASVKRGADMIRQVLSFARGIEGKRTVVDVVRLLRDLEAFGREALPSNIVLRMNVPVELWHIIGDSTQLLQVLVNLITNARDAMPDGGTITITAADVDLKDEYSSVSHLASPGRYIAIDVEDNGVGMSPQVVDKAFEPFFTTKQPGSGTGLGLASSLAIVRAHGGYMQVYSEPGHGSRFQLHLAAAEDETLVPLDARNRSTADLPTGNGETILVVDDEDAIRQLARQTIETYGYHTLGARNGAEALDVLAKSGVPVDLVLTDMMMPVMDGAALAAALAASHPHIPVVATSGLNANGGVARASQAGVHHFLSKPFTTQTLIQAINDSLRERAGRDD